MSNKATRIKGEMFRCTTMHCLWDRLISGGFDHCLPSTLTRAVDGEDVNLEELFHKNVIYRLEDIQERTVLNAVKFHDTLFAIKMSIALFRACNAITAKTKGELDQEILHICQEKGYPGFEPFGTRALDMFLPYHRSQNVLLARVFQWLIHGKNTYVLSDGLSQHLKMSNLNNCPVEYIRFPTPAAYVALNPEFVSPETLLEGFEIQEAYAVNNVIPDGVWVYFGESEVGYFLNVTICAFANARSGPTVLLVDSPNRMILPTKGTCSDIYYEDADGNKVEDTMLDHLKQLITGVCVYLTSSNADAILSTDSPEYTKWVKELNKARGKRHRKIKTQLDKIKETPVVFLGKSLSVIDRHGDKSAAYLGGTHASPRMHYRNGHFRWQPYGPKDNQKLKHIYISPQMINVNNGPAVTTEKVTLVR